MRKIHTKGKKVKQNEREITSKKSMNEVSERKKNRKTPTPRTINERMDQHFNNSSHVSAYKIFTSQIIFNVLHIFHCLQEKKKKKESNL